MQNPLIRLVVRVNNIHLPGSHYLPPRVPTGMLGSTIHGSVPCSNWEITSGLETWSPSHWNLKKSYLSAVREKCLLRVHSHRFVFRGKERWTNQMEVKHIQSFDVTRSKMWYNLGTDLGLEKLLVCPSTY